MLKKTLKLLEELKQEKLENGETEPAEYECPICHGLGATFSVDENGYEVSRWCDCHNQAIKDEAKSRNGIKDLFAAKDIHNYKANTAEQKAAVKTVCDYIRNFTDESLLLCGNVGSGKTHLAVAVAKELERLGHKVKFKDYPEMMQELENEKFDAIRYSDAMRKIKDAPVLVIDDLFKTGFSEWNGRKIIKASHKERIYQIINYRMTNRKPVIITTELGMEAFYEFEEAITSRIIGMAGNNWFEFKEQENMRLK